MKKRTVYYSKTCTTAQFDKHVTCMYMHGTSWNVFLIRESKYYACTIILWDQFHLRLYYIGVVEELADQAVA